MRRRTRLVIAAVAAVGLFTSAGVYGLSRPGANALPVGGDPVAVAAPGDAERVDRLRGASLDSMISGLEKRVEAAPGDYVSSATLGLAYVQQARITINPYFYPRAQAALDKSLATNEADNFLGYAGRSALAAARHDFPEALKQATRGLEINPYSALLYGALSDAQIQLGQYDAAFTSVQRMVDLSPDTASLTRASYTWELRGNTTRATELMQRALEDAPSGADRTFALHHLAQLSFDAGDPSRALELELRALAASPDDPAARFGRAQAEFALGQVETALDHFKVLVVASPEPSYLMTYGALLDSLGRTGEAALQYSIVEATSKLFAAQGVLPDADAVLNDVRTGGVDKAVSDAERALPTRPFLALRDAYAWALHSAGRDAEALVQSDLALSLGTRNALYEYHAGMIRLALGDSTGGQAHLRVALAINPYFDPVAAAMAKDRLATLATGG
jgi:tetratricopeptide (TPR) repeat protein